MGLLALLLLLTACTPKVQVEAPKDPIVINMNVRIEQEVRLNVEDEVEYLFADNANLFPKRTAAQGAAGDPAQLGRARSPLAARRVGSLDRAKMAGLVGERIDGYVGVVDPGTAGEAAALVDQINAERRVKYQEIAEQEGAPLVAVAQIAGEKLIERTPDGQFVMGPDGRWTRK